MTKNKADYAYPVVDSSALNPFTTPGSAALSIKNADLQEVIQVDEVANKELARRIGVGVQVYDCVEGAWKGREPQANLYDIETRFSEASTSSALSGPMPTVAGSRVNSLRR